MGRSLVNAALGLHRTPATAPHPGAPSWVSGNLSYWPVVDRGVCPQALPDGSRAGGVAPGRSGLSCWKEAVPSPSHDTWQLQLCSHNKSVLCLDLRDASCTGHQLGGFPWTLLCWRLR